MKQLVAAQIASDERAALAEERAAASEAARLAAQLASDARFAVAMEAIGRRQVPTARDLSERMEKFVYSAEENATFDLWYARYEEIFSTETAEMTDAQKLNLLTEKLSYQDYLKFANTILPLTKATIPFADAVTQLKRMFGRKESQFALRYRCLKVEMEAGEDFDTYAARVNLKCEKFDIAKCTPDDFKVLMFVQGLNKSQHSLTLEKLLTKLDEQEKRREAAEDPDTIAKLKLQDVVNIATRIGYLKGEKSMVMSQTPPAADVMIVREKPKQNVRRSNFSGSSRDAGGESKPPYP